MPTETPDRFEVYVPAPRSEPPPYSFDVSWSALGGTFYERFRMTAATFWPPPLDLDPNARDGEWHGTIRLPHEVIEYEGRAVPLFEGDVERIEWERERAERRR